MTGLLTDWGKYVRQSKNLKIQMCEKIKEFFSLDIVKCLILVFFYFQYIGCIIL